MSSPTSHHSAALLHEGILSCRQIRVESIRIYYLENKWSIECLNWDGSIYKGFFDHLKHRRGISVRASGKMETHWTNSGFYKNKAALVAFIKTLHENKDLRRIRHYDDRRGQKAAAIGAFEIAHRMHKRSWAEVVSVLEVFLHEIAKDKKGWSWE